jgi:hypothetical protein
MAEGDKKDSGANRINEKQRFTFIGFDVFPGKPKDLFKSDAEKQKLVDSVRAKRKSDSTLRDECILLEERVSFGEKLILAVASVAILTALILPWYSAYMVVPAASEPVAAVEEPVDAALTGTDSLAEADSLVASDDTTAMAGLTDDTTITTAVVEEPTEVEDQAAASAAGVTTHEGERANEQIITARAARARTAREYSQLTGIGTFASLGTVGSAVFGSGFILVLTAVFMLIYGLLCIVLPVVNLYTLFGIKGKPDDVAEKIKRHLRLNWLPLILFTVVLLLSFVGAEYGFNVEESFTSLGESYGVAVLLGSLSWGIFVALAASILVAVKGIEI